jgi:predicted transcriptional regulator
MSYIRYYLNNCGVIVASKFEGRIYKMLSDEPVTPNEVAKKIEVSHKTAQRVLMHLALTRDDVKYKNSGRIHLFWKKES